MNQCAFSSLAPIAVGYDPVTYTTTESDGSVTLTVRIFGAPRPLTLVLTVTVPQATETISGTTEPECGKQRCKAVEEKNKVLVFSANRCWL